MTKPRTAEPARGALDIVEEVFHVLRRAPLRVLGAYYVGTLPFVLGLLYFWGDMSRSALAQRHIAGGALGLTLLFIWMKAWQTVYGRQVLAAVLGETLPRMTVRGLMRRAVRQTIVQPLGLIALPATLFFLVPFVWTYAFYQNLTVLDDGAEDLSELTRKAVRLARLWPRQNALLVWALSPFLLVTAMGIYLVMMPIGAALAPNWTMMLLGFYATLYATIVAPLSPFGVVVAVNIALLFRIAPQLLKMILGVQTVFATNPEGMINSTFFAVVAALTYLCMDPLIKAAYALRCFYGESLQTGADLKLELKRLTKSGVLLLCIAAAALVAGGRAVAETPAEAPDPAAPSANEPEWRVTPAALDEALSRELDAPLYAWRMPREQIDDSKQGLISRWLQEVADGVAQGLQTLKEWMRKAMDWLDKHVFRGIGDHQPRGLNGITEGLRLLLYLLLTVLLAVAAVVLVRLWRQRRKPSDVRAEALPARPDLEDEETTAEALPEDGWVALARELDREGNWRLATRAAFLANLAGLAQRELIRIARFKSNRDYEIELRRRGHAAPQIPEVFKDSVSRFEAVWYGEHLATREGYGAVMANLERLQIREQTE